MTAPSVLPGPFLTRTQAARRAGVPPAELAALPGAVRLAGPWDVEEVYPAFQFARSGGFLPGLPGVVSTVGAVLADRDLVGWLLEPWPELGGRSVVEWLTAGRPAAAVEALAAGATRAA